MWKNDSWKKNAESGLELGTTEERKYKTNKGKKYNIQIQIDDRKNIHSFFILKNNARDNT